MIKITADDVKAGLTALVEQKGADYVYTSWMYGWGYRCTYVKDGEGDCGVGCYLINKGVPASRLIEFDQQEYAVGAPSVLDALRHEGVLDFEIEASDMLKNFQRYQDSGHTWGLALRKTLDESSK